MRVDGLQLGNDRLCGFRPLTRVRRGLTVLAVLLAAVCLSPVAIAPAAPETAKKAPKAADASRRAKQEQREESVRAICAQLGIGKGAAVADIGAGKGADTWTFAAVVGKDGAVYAEEIAKGMVDRIEEEAKTRELLQVRGVLGQNDDPCLPESSCDLAYMHHVYHHFSQPREMLRGIRRGLKPGGYLVIIDRNKGTLRDWVPREQRREKHFWIAETTVVREAREEGFLFVGIAEDRWSEKDPFVLVFQRPKDTNEPGRDPDPLLPLEVEKVSRLLLPLRGAYRRPVFVALGEGRALIGPIVRSASGQGLDIVLEEWATQKDERPPLPENVDLPSVLTESGDPHLGPEPIDAVFFLDSFHLLFHGKTLLAKLHEKLAPEGCIYVLDRQAKEPLSRREASHRRKISRETVKEEMAAAGFVLWFEGPQPAADRFLLVFGKTPPEEISPKEDLFVAGPEIPGPPGQWLSENLWRLRGLKAADGQVVRLDPRQGQLEPEKAPASSPGEEAWKLPAAGLVLTFEKKPRAYALTKCRKLEGNR